MLDVLVIFPALCVGNIERNGCAAVEIFNLCVCSEVSDKIKL